MDQTEKHCEVARLLRQIDLEIEAAHQGLHGLAAGTARHRFINARLARVSDLHGSLRTLMGEQAITLIAQHFETVLDDDATAGMTSSREAQTHKEVDDAPI